MVKHLTNGVIATSARAGIHTSISHTSLIPGAIGRQCAFGTTTLIWISLIVVLTTALATETISIRSAWIRATWITRSFGDHFHLGQLAATDEGITSKAIDAVANGQMVKYMALGLKAARAGTGIATLLINARLRGSTLRSQYALRATVRGCANEVR